MAKQQSIQFKEGSLVWIKPLKKQGKIIAVTKGIPQTYKVEIIVNFNKETGERTTKLETVKAEDLKPYRRNKSKSRKLKKYNPNEMYYMVKKFQQAFNHPVADKPTVMDSQRAVSRSVWVAEELVEKLHASSDSKEEFLELYNQFLQGIEKAKEKSLKSEPPKGTLDKLTAQVDALTDALYFIFGSFVEIGVKPYRPFKIVQTANMAKLFPDGKPRYRESDGKIIKPDGWEENYAPEKRIKEEVKRQLGE